MSGGFRVRRGDPVLGLHSVHRGGNRHMPSGKRDDYLGYDEREGAVQDPQDQGRDHGWKAFQ